LHDEAQLMGWRRVAEAVHSEGGHHFCADHACRAYVRPTASGWRAAGCAIRRSTPG
jgi:2,4-dienoyl-CoA reductase-like NADH-dependent reductase (Old Yellow Enzyme family)